MHKVLFLPPSESEIKLGTVLYTFFNRLQSGIGCDF